MRDMEGAEIQRELRRPQHSIFVMILFILCLLPVLPVLPVYLTNKAQRPTMRPQAFLGISSYRDMRDARRKSEYGDSPL